MEQVLETFSKEVNYYLLGHPAIALLLALIRGLERKLSSNTLLTSVTTACVGPTLAFVLGQRASYKREELVASKQASSVRKMLELEINHNLKLLTSFQGEVISAATAITDQLSSPPPVPNWYHKVFDSQISSLPAALSEEKIVETLGFYSFLDTDIPLKLKALESAKSSIESRFRFGPIVSEEYWAQLSKQWSELIELIEGALDRGNPLQGK